MSVDMSRVNFEEIVEATRALDSEQERLNAALKWEESAINNLQEAQAEVAETRSKLLNAKHSLMEAIGKNNWGHR